MKRFADVTLVVLSVYIVPNLISFAIHNTFKNCPNIFHPSLKIAELSQTQFKYLPYLIVLQKYSRVICTREDLAR